MKKAPPGVRQGLMGFRQMGTASREGGGALQRREVSGGKGASPGDGLWFQEAKTQEAARARRGATDLAGGCELVGSGRLAVRGERVLQGCVLERARSPRWSLEPLAERLPQSAVDARSANLHGPSDICGALTRRMPTLHLGYIH